MHKKRKKQPSRARSKRSVKPREVTSASARAVLDAGKFREAIADFKDLLRREPGPESTLGLADAYAGRAKQLAAKGMDREALVMWENRARLGDVPIFADYARLLLRLGRISEAIVLYQTPESLADRDCRQLIGTHLAARYAAHDPALEQVLASDDPILVHGVAARQALDAYCNGDDEAVATALGAIPFRSPYRDLVQILKGLQRIDEAPGEAERLFARVGEDSAFAGLRCAAELVLIPEDQLAERLGSAGPATRDLVFALRGWSAERRTLWHELHKLGASPTPKQLLALMHRHAELLGEQWVRQRGLRLIVSGGLSPASCKQAMRAKRLLPLERTHVAALDAEAKHDAWSIVDSWREYGRSLLLVEGNEAGSERSMRIALALRRPDRAMDVLDRPRDSRDPHWDAVVEHTVRMLEESLGYDPDDRDTYLRLINHFRRSGALKDARRILTRAQQRWPEDKHVLTAAMETALASGAFKKAATIARDILAVDPINSGVRETLIDAHLSHARKHLRGVRPDLAVKSLQDAEEWIRGEGPRERLELLRGFVKLETDKGGGEADLKRISARLGDGLEARLVIALEAERSTRGTLRSLLSRLGLVKAPKAEISDLLAFLVRLREALDGGSKPAPKTVDYFASALKSAARLKLDKSQRESACETLRRAGMDGVRLTFAMAGLKRWSGEPVFELHAIGAKYAEEGPFGLTQQDLFRLEDALERARADGDMRLAHEIQELLQKIVIPYGRPFGSPPEMPFDIDFGLDDDEEDDDELIDSPFDLLDVLEGIVDDMGPDAVWDLLKAKNNPIGDMLREIQHAIGKPQLRALIESLAEGSEEGGFDPFADPLPIDPPKARQPARPKTKAKSQPRPKPKPKPKTKPSPESSDLEDDPIQTDLFE